MNSKVKELYDYMEFLRELWECEQNRNPYDADMLIGLQTEINDTYKQIEVFKRFKVAYI